MFEVSKVSEDWGCGSVLAYHARGCGFNSQYLKKRKCGKTSLQGLGVLRQMGAAMVVCHLVLWWVATCAGWVVVMEPGTWMGTRDRGRGDLPFFTHLVREKRTVQGGKSWNGLRKSTRS